MKYMKFFFLVSLLSFFIPNNGHAQKEQKEPIKYSSRIELDGREINEVIEVRVLKGNTYFTMDLKGNVTSGKASVILYNPNGKKMCGFSLNAREGGEAKGTMSEVQNAKPGIWKIKIKNDTGIGEMNIKFGQY